ncbi:MAG TPA: 6-bladed beta-propeller [Vicinamibacterales bacterium]|nr:6-bladed beta-propeller [Vicinamibacterales bacterium]
MNRSAKAIALRAVGTTVCVGGLLVAAVAQAPSFQVEPLWPRPFPVEKHWILGSVTGVAVDARDHIFVVHRGVDSLQNNEKGPTLEPWASSCCFSAPQVLEFDANGTLVNSWDPKGGSGYDWPTNPSGIAVDSKGNIWIGSGLMPSALPAGRGRGPAPEGAAARGGRGDAAARGGAAAAQGRGGRGGPAGPPPAADAMVLKFDKTGKFVSQIGKRGQTDASNNANLDRPLGIAIDDAANELYVADDGHSRIAVFDANSGAFKREWKANGEPFKTITCVELSKDGMVYVCDRNNDRIQVFDKQGKFQKEASVSSSTKGDGSVWAIAFSRDPQQQFMYVADGHDKKVWILNRKSLESVGSFGQGGRLAGEFYGVDAVATDSKGNVYTGETYEGKRVQKFDKK